MTSRSYAGSWVKEQRDVDSTVAAAANFLHALGVPVALQQLGSRVRTHPRFPKLAALIDSLEEAGAPVQAVGGDVEELPTAPMPAIAHVNDNGQPRFVVLVEVADGAVRYIDSRVGPVRTDLEEFGKLWSGVLLIAAGPVDRAPGAHAQQRATRRAEQLESVRVPVLLGIGLVVLAALALFTWQPLPPEFEALWYMLAAVKVAGLLACAALVMMGRGFSARLTQRLCPAGRVVDCASVLQSPAARLFGWIPMADLGALYFLGGLLALAGARWTGDHSGVFGLLTVLTLLTLPYSVFSVVYQGIVVRRWCWLCLVVMGLFWTEALLMMLTSPVSLQAALTQLPSSAWPLAAVSYVLPAVAWGLLMPLYRRAASYGLQTEELLRHRRNPILIDQWLNEQQPAQLGSFQPEIARGPESAPLELTIVSHPLCVVCQEVHRVLDRLVVESRGQIRGVVRLGYRARKEAGGDIARRVIGIALSQDGEAAYDALHDWYAQPSQGAARWLERHPLPQSPCTFARAIEEVFEAHCAAVKSAGITGVPSMFLNGRALPPELAPEDLRIFLRLQS